MRANYRLQRLFVEGGLAPGARVEATPDQAHYLKHVLRMVEGGELLVFNGRDGEWAARIAEIGRKSVTLEAISQTRPQPPAPDLVFCFAPLKVGRLDYLVQKAVEMGVGVIQPVITQYTQNSRVSRDKLHANAIEAAEQCGVLAVPDVRDAMRFEALLDGWDSGRRLIFCDEAAEGDNPLPILKRLTDSRLGLLIGPEGGFSDTERMRLRSLPFVTAIPLGPRILRADTAAVAALTILQATVGDWR